MVQRGAARDNIEVAYTNVDVEAYRPEPAVRAVVRTQLRLDPSIPTLLYPARLCAQKQPRVFAGTMQALVRRGVDCAAIVAGDGPEMAWLRDFVHRNHLDQRVRFAGAVWADRMAQLYCASDVLFLPSAWEGISLSIYEAMASGLPIVAAAVGGQHELVTPECGVLLPRSDEQTEVSAYADTLVALLAAPERMRSMGEAGRCRVAEHFAIERMHERLLALLTTARQRHGTDPRSVPPEGLAAACAAQAVECVRLQRLSDRLWTERRHDSFLVRAYQAFSRRFQPLYQRGVDRGWDWLPRLRTRVKLSLLGRV
jgi:glycosyltransferase involved in cell wall biosynthesis